ncbi:hypothetical protein WDW86_00090 [Bdellovibrionota bacterium FG-2]
MATKSQKLGRNPFDKKKTAKPEPKSAHVESQKVEALPSLASWTLNWLTVDLPAEIIMTGIKITALAYSEFRRPRY